jgi:hypothetical protein
MFVISTGFLREYINNRSPYLHIKGVNTFEASEIAYHVHV